MLGNKTATLQTTLNRHLGSTTNVEEPVSKTRIHLNRFWFEGGIWDLIACLLLSLLWCP